MKSIVFLLILAFHTLCTKAQFFTNPVAGNTQAGNSKNANKFKVLSTELDNLKKDTSLKNASISFYAWDVKNREVIGELNADQSLVPASTLKVVTTAAALEILGVSERFRTTVEYDGLIDSAGTLNGNIYIRGGGDPCLGSGIFEKHYYKPSFYKVWVDSIKRKIKRINGAIIGDDSIFDEQTPSTWIWGDMANYYGATAYGISVYDNMYSLYFDTGKEKGDSTRITGTDPEISGLKIVNKVRASGEMKDNSYIIGAPFDLTRYAYGFLPKDKKKYEVCGSIPDPALLTAQELGVHLVSAGVVTTKEISTARFDKGKISPVKNRVFLCATKSPSVADIVYWTNHVSMNLYAETLLKHIGLKKYGSGDTWSGAKALTEFWKSKGVDIRGMSLNDGSGLSRYNAVSSKQIVQVLSYMKTSKNFDTFYNSLPAAGLSGTIRKMFKNTNAEKNLRAKSGYMSRIRSYGGYVRTRSDRDVVFAVIVNNYNCSDQEMKEKIETILVKLADLNE